MTKKPKTLKEIAIELLEKYEASETTVICEYSTNIRRSEELLKKEVAKYRKMIDKADRKTEPTISKMEQVDKDINARSKDEPQAGEMMTEEEFDSMLARVLTGKDEPQTNADQHVQHVGSVEQTERSE